MAKIVNRKFDDIRKLEIVTIQDDFGAQMILQHPLTMLGYNFDAEEQKAIELMDLNVQTYRLHLERRNALNALVQDAQNAGGVENPPANSQG